MLLIDSITKINCVILCWKIYLSLEHEDSQSQDKACWTREMLHVFCDICIKTIEKGMRPNTYFDKTSWKYVTTTFKEKIGHGFTKAQLKNKWDGMKGIRRYGKEYFQNKSGLEFKVGNYFCHWRVVKSKIQVWYYWINVLILLQFFIIILCLSCEIDVQCVNLCFCNMIALCFCWMFVRDRLTHNFNCRCWTIWAIVLYVVVAFKWLRCC